MHGHTDWFIRLLALILDKSFFDERNQEKILKQVLGRIWPNIEDLLIVGSKVTEHIKPTNKQAPFCGGKFRTYAEDRTA